MQNTTSYLQKKVDEIVRNAENNFTTSIDSIVNLSLDSFREQIKKEFINIVEQIRRDNLQQLKQDLLGNNAMSNFNIDGIVDKLSQLIISKTLYNNLIS